MIIELPVSNDSSQDFTTQLGENNLRFALKYNSRTGLRTMDLYLADTNEPLLTGVPLVVGENFLAPYNFGLGILFMADLSNTGSEATHENFGSTVKLVWASDEEALR